MSKHSWLLPAVLSVVALVSLLTTQVSVRAQAPTKTPIGEPPTKTPLPDIPDTSLPTPVELPKKVPTLTPSPAATVSRTPTPLTRSPAHPCRHLRPPLPIQLLSFQHLPPSHRLSQQPPWSLLSLRPPRRSPRRQRP
jgi:hypothetical protein